MQHVSRRTHLHAFRSDTSTSLRASCAAQGTGGGGAESGLWSDPWPALHDRPPGVHRRALQALSQIPLALTSAHWSSRSFPGLKTLVHLGQHRVIPVLFLRK